MQPLSIAVLAALTPPEWERGFYDDRLEEIDYDEPTDLAAISIEAYTARRGYQIAAEYRRRGVPVVMGGFHATLCPEEVKEHADAVCVGEAEPVWLKILNDTLSHSLVPEYNGTPTNLEGITPDRSIFDGKNYFFLTLVETGRGCRFNCSFCSVSAFYHQTYRRRPVQEVVAELSHLKHKLIFFVDDNMVGDTANAKELFRAIKPLGLKWVSQGSLNAAADEEVLRLMAESGCQGLLVGLESLSKDNLEALDKESNTKLDYVTALRRFRRRGIMIYGTFMFGLPGDTKELVQQTVDFTIKHGFWIGAFAHIVPFPGTRLHASYQEQGRFIYPRWWLEESFRFGQVPYMPQTMSATDLAECCYQARRHYYSWPSILRRGIANCSNPVKAMLYFGTNLVLKREQAQRLDIPLGLVDTQNSRGGSPRGRLATSADDAGIRHLLRETPMPGALQIAFLKEPGFLPALSVEGRFSQAFIGVVGTGRIIGVASRSVKNAFINGQVSPLGYLSALRLAADQRGGIYLARGYKLLKELHADGRTKIYITTIIEANLVAARLLTSGRAGLPAYHDLGRYRCLAISLKQRVGTLPQNGLTVRQATIQDIPSIIAFWRREGPRRQFFPEYMEEDLMDTSGGMLRGLSLQDIWLAYLDGSLVGTAAAWDQSSFRQSLFLGVGRRIPGLRAVYNLAARAAGYPLLPPRGTMLSYFNLSLACIKDNDARTFNTLFRRMMLHYRDRYSLLMAGFHERDPLFAEISRYRGFSYGSRLYVACWEDGEEQFRSLDGRVPYLELGAL
jgi:radical SAM superfamily enzyme YgiQ (UPF0313 family)